MGQNRKFFMRHSPGTYTKPSADSNYGHYYWDNNNVCRGVEEHYDSSSSEKGFFESFGCLMLLPGFFITAN